MSESSRAEPVAVGGAALLATCSLWLFVSTALPGWLQLAWAPVILVAIGLASWARRRTAGGAPATLMLLFSMTVAAVEVALWASARA